MESVDLKKLILRYLAGSLSEQETAFLKEWLEKRENRELFERICDKEHILEQAAVFDKYSADSGKVWSSLKRRLRPSGRRRLVRMRYAAVLLLPLCLGSIFYLQSHTASPDELPASHGRVDGAVLTLSDGRSIALEQLANNTIVSGQQTFENAGGVLSCLDTARAVEDRGEKVVYHVITTPSRGVYKVVLPDGTEATLNAGSSLKFPSRFEGECRQVWVAGELYFDVKRDTCHPFVVVSDYSRVEVLGTQFNVRAYADHTHAVTLLSGSVRMEGGGEGVVLEPGQQALLEPGRQGLEVKEVDAGACVAWRAGRFLFDNASLEEIMYDLGKWYGVDVFFENGTVKMEHFSVDIDRSTSLEEVIALLEQTGTVRFTLKDEIVFVK